MALDLADTSASPIDQLIRLLDLEPIEENIFRGVSPKDRSQRVFGGQVLGQALVAATRTIEDRLCHSLHAYFLLPGDPKVPILYEVDRSRDGKSFSSRRVVAATSAWPSTCPPKTRCERSLGLTPRKMFSSIGSRSSSRINWSIGLAGVSARHKAK